MCAFPLGHPQPWRWVFHPASHKFSHSTASVALHPCPAQPWFWQICNLQIKIFEVSRQTQVKKQDLHRSLAAVRALAAAKCGSTGTAERDTNPKYDCDGLLRVVFSVQLAENQNLASSLTSVLCS